MITTLEMRELSPGVAEVYEVVKIERTDDDPVREHQVGMITWNPEQMTTRWYATYANGDDTADCADRYAALESLRLQHAAVQRFVRSVRSIRPAPMIGSAGSRQSAYDQGYNQALRDVERLAQEVVGLAPTGEGFTAITRPTN